MVVGEIIETLTIMPPTITNQSVTKILSNQSKLDIRHKKPARGEYNCDWHPTTTKSKQLN